MVGFVGRNMNKSTSEQSLRRSVDVIVSDDGKLFSKLLDESPGLATASPSQGATRQRARPCFIQEIGHYIHSGDTALHFAVFRSVLAVLTREDPPPIVRKWPEN